ncbi:MAG: hypothetical protein IPK10_08915 [Bacteroidetes bacterium]|nr:hypothetical protein [Bacteroidota bacterium]
MDTIRVYNTHLQSNHFKKNEYDFIEHADSIVADKKIKKHKEHFKANSHSGCEAK